MTASLRQGCRQGIFVLLEQLWEKPLDFDAFGSPLNLMGWPPSLTIAPVIQVQSARQAPSTDARQSGRNQTASSYQTPIRLWPQQSWHIEKSMDYHSWKQTGAPLP